MITIAVERVGGSAGAACSFQVSQEADDLADAIPRALLASHIKPEDAVAYYLAEPADGPVVGAPRSQGRPLDSTAFTNAVNEYVKDSHSRYLRIAAEKARKLSAECNAALAIC